MRASILAVILSLFIFELNAQFPYGTALVPAGVEFHIVQTDQELIQGALSEKTITKSSYYSTMQAQILWDDPDFMRMKRSKNFSLRGAKIVLNNYSSTFPEGTEITVFPHPKVPQYPLFFTKEIKAFGPDPCDGGFSQPGDGEYKAVLNRKEFYDGIAQHNSVAEAMFNVSLTGIQSCNEYLFFNITSGGAYFENGRINHPVVEGIQSVLTASFEGKGCRRVWEDNKSISGVIFQMYTDQADYSETPTPNNAWLGRNGEYKRSETVEEEGEIVQRREELYLMKIDTAEFFDYLREKPEIKKFVANGSHYSVVESDGFVKSTDIHYTMVMTLGKQHDFTISAVNQQVYENWMPGHEDYMGSWSPVAFKAEFIDETEADSICFKLQAVSHLPGICTNYPILPKDAPEELPDIYFAPQDQQTDPAIIVLNDTVAMTNRKVRSAEVVVLSRDFGGYAEITATSMSTDKMAQSKPDQLYFVEIPFDENGNLIADAWEKQMGTEGLGKNTDDDHLPAGIRDRGDGLTAFEEYRGFVSLKDVIAPSDPDRMQRHGSHIRTSPICRDVFVFDPQMLFARYYHKINPAECHWHYLARDQVRVPSSGFNVAIEGSNTTQPPDEDNSPKAAEDRAKIQKTIDLLNNWAKQEYRRINANSPEIHRNNKQFALHLIESPDSEYSTGFCASLEVAGKSHRSPLEYNHLIVIPKQDVVKDALLSLFKEMGRRWDDPFFIQRFTNEDQLKIVENVYESMIPHEIGHGLGLQHHDHGKMTLENQDSGDHVLVPDSAKYLIEGDDYEEIYHKDGKSYGFTSIRTALWAMGVDECCMRYTTEREIDFITGRVMKPSLSYCKKGQNFINGTGRSTPADDCFGSIKIRCEN